MKKIFVVAVLAAWSVFALADKVDIDTLPAKDPVGLKNGITQKGLDKVGKRIDEDIKDAVAKSKSGAVNKKQKSQEVVFNPLENSGGYTFSGDDVEFHTHWSTCGQHSYYAYGGTSEKDENRVGYKAGYGKLPDNPNRYEKELDFSSRCHSVNEGETVVYMNNNPKRFLAIKVLKANRDDLGRGKPSLKVRYRIY